MSTSINPRGFALACIGGQGHVLLNDRWEICRAGEAYLCPKGSPRAYRALPGHPWDFVWTIYAEPPRWLQKLPTDCHLICYNQALPLSSAVDGLYREVNGHNEQIFATQWASLIGSYWNATTERGKTGGRLHFLWEKVDGYLAYPWTLNELARVAGVSSEHLRRICLSETGRSPMKHLTLLRMRRAETLLLNQRLKVSAVAESVGYSNPFAFSTAYKKWSGSSPSHHWQDDHPS
ncbi:MAG: helix-turn-helix domain-containing protein [bacterium]